MPDGVRLAAKLWLPDIAAKKRVPTIIEVIPYRKRDIYAPRDAMHHRYFAGHGYATMRVDIRGSGDSDGMQGVFATNDETDDTVRSAQVDRAAAVERRPGRHVRHFVGRLPGHTDCASRAARVEGGDRAVVRARPLSLQPGLSRRVRAAALDPLVEPGLRLQVASARSRARRASAGARCGWRGSSTTRRRSSPRSSIRRSTRTGASARSTTTKSRRRSFAVSGWADGAYVGSVSESLREAQSRRAKA